MDSKFVSALAIFTVSVILIGLPAWAAVKAQSSNGTLGKDIAETFRSVIKKHQNNIKEFILETRLSVANTTQAKLEVIDFYINESLRTEIEEVKKRRAELVAALQAGEIDNETFTMEMRDLTSDLVDVAKKLGIIGEKLHALSEDLAEDLKTRAEQLTGELEDFSDEITSVAEAVADEMRNRDLPVPEMPVEPDIPSAPQTNIP
jgi:phosphoglycerate-specific signal transduction histidine kinase